MAVSGSYDFNLTRNQIIRQAALEVHAVGAEDTLSGVMMEDFSFKLNGMVKAWQATGIHVWTTEEAVLFPAVSQAKYTINSTSSDRIVADFSSTTLSADEASGQTVISVTSVTGISVDDYVGIIVDDGTLHWAQVDAVGASDITIDTALDDSAASGNKVFFYTGSIIQRPLKIVHARRYDFIDGTETPIDVISRLDYNRLSQKAQTGVINQLFYDPGRDTGLVYLYLVPSTIDTLVKFTYHRPIQDFDAAGDNPDLPQEWIMALIYNLAESQLAQFPVENNIADRIMRNAARYLDLVIGYDREEESVFIQPDMSGY